jgi:hypothetical protein
MLGLFVQVADKRPPVNVKEVCMKKTVWMFILSAGLLAFGTASLSADTFYTVQANIPFGFMVGGEAFQPGAYTIARIGNDPSALVLRSPDGGKSVAFLTIGTYSPKVSENTRLVFNRYGNEYFLKEVWTVGDLTGRELLPSNSERELKSAMHQAKVAGLALAAAQ